MRKRFLGWVVMGAFVGVAMSIFMGPLMAQTVQAVQGELKRIAQEIYSVEEGLADLELQAKRAATVKAILELEQKNLDYEYRLWKLTANLIEQEKIFLEMKPELFRLAAAGEAKPLALLIALEKAIAQVKDRLAAAWKKSAAVEWALVSAKQRLFTSPAGAGPGCCVKFDPLPLGTVYHVGDVFADCARITVLSFTWTSMGTTTAGYARVVASAKAGGSGHELAVNNVNLGFDFGQPLKGLTLKFGEYGGNLNIEVNGDFRNFENFKDIDGKVIGGVHVSVPVGGYGNDKGVLKLEGEIDTLVIGGQELFLDDICPIEE